MNRFVLVSLLATAAKQALQFLTRKIAHVAAFLQHSTEWKSLSLGSRLRAPMPKKPELPRQAACFIQTMDCLPVSKLPEGRMWTYDIKLDGYRLEVVRRGRETTLYSRRQNVFNKKFP
jgi:ATP-dependent DNA ligase